MGIGGTSAQAARGGAARPAGGDEGSFAVASHRDYPHRLRTTLPSTRPALNRGVRAVLKLARSCGWGEERLTDLEIALREALANAMIHGNSLERKKRVFLRCYASADPSMMIVVRDEGSGFDPNRVPDPRDRNRLELSNGRGLLLMRELMDHVEYRRGGREVLLVVRSS